MVGYEKDSHLNWKTCTITIAAQFPTAPLFVSCFHVFISYTYLFCIKRSNTKSFLIYGTRLETMVWSLASRLDHDSVPVRETKRQIILAEWCISTTQNCLGNNLVLLLSKNITAIPNKHAWETGKPKNVEISASSGMRKLALKSICATFSPVTPPFSIDFWKADVKCN